MKTKGITIWEQHLEHMVLGIAVLVLIAFSALQFVGSPNAVTAAGEKQPIGPGEVDKKLEEKAREISDKLQQSSVSALPAAVEQLPKFNDLKAASVSPPLSAVAFQSSVHPGGGVMVSQSDRPFNVANIPAPINVACAQYFDTILPEVMAEFSELAKILPEQPDVTWNTVAAKFRYGDVLRQFRSRGPNGESPLPPAWYNDRVDFIDVKLEREEYVSGNWTNRVVLEHIPGQF